MNVFEQIGLGLIEVNDILLGPIVPKLKLRNPVYALHVDPLPFEAFNDGGLYLNHDAFLLSTDRTLDVCCLHGLVCLELDAPWTEPVALWNRVNVLLQTRLMAAREARLTDYDLVIVSPVTAHANIASHIVFNHVFLNGDLSEARLKLQGRGWFLRRLPLITALRTLAS